LSPLDNYKKKAIHEFIKDLECHNRYFSDTDKAKIRNTVVPFFHRFIHKKTNENAIENHFLPLKN